MKRKLVRTLLYLGLVLFLGYGLTRIAYLKGKAELDVQETSSPHFQLAASAKEDVHPTSLQISSSSSSTDQPVTTPSSTDQPVTTLRHRLAFDFPGHDSLPHHKYLKSAREIKEEPWVATLHQYLLTLNKSVSPHVHFVFGDYKHRMIVLNWVVAATVKLEPPLHRVMVLSLQQPLCDFLENSTYNIHPPQVTCITAPVDTVLLSLTGDAWIAAVMVRQIVLRLINFWGYDVAAYDSDAVVLKNPQELYQQYHHDLLASASIWPDYQAKPWGFTLCTGTLVYRASFAVEMLWKILSNITVRDDQVSMNTAIQDMNISWTKTTAVTQVCSIDGWEGEADGGLKVFVFPERLVCRGHCCSGNKSGLYVVHPSGTHGAIRLKSHSLASVNAWFISERLFQFISMRWRSWVKVWATGM